MSELSSAEFGKILPHPAPLSGNARLALFAMRQMAAAGLNDANAALALFMNLHGGYRRPLVLMRALMAEISRTSNRKLMVAPCCCARMTADEARLIKAIGSSLEQTDAANAAFQSLLDQPHCLGVVSTAQALAQAFADLGRPLHDRL